MDKKTMQRSIAESCYDHLGGRLGEEFFKYMQDNEWIICGINDEEPVITQKGLIGLQNLSIDINKLQKTKRKAFCACIERFGGQIYRHTGAYLGSLLKERLIELEWLVEKQERQLELTDKGITGLKAIGLELPD